MMDEKYDPGMNVFMNLSDCISIRFRFELKSYIEFVQKYVKLKVPFWWLILLVLQIRIFYLKFGNLLHQL